MFSLAGKAMRATLLNFTTSAFPYIATMIAKNAPQKAASQKSLLDSLKLNKRDTDRMVSNFYYEP